MPPFVSQEPALAHLGKHYNVASALKEPPPSDGNGSS